MKQRCWVGMLGTVLLLGGGLLLLDRSTPTLPYAYATGLLLGAGSALVMVSLVAGESL